jgi:signal transduction histidine kinase
MSPLFRLTTVLHGLTDLGAIASALLSTLITEEGLGFERSVLFLLDRPARKLRGYDAAGERERELTRDFWKLLDGFPESLGDAVRLTLDPRRRLRSPLAKKARRICYSLEEMSNPAVRAAVTSNPITFPSHEMPDPADLTQALGEGPWSYWPVIGPRGVAGVLGVAGGYAQPLPEGVRELLVILSYHAGLSIERGQAYQSLERQLAEMATVQEVCRGILSATNLHDLLHLISRVASRVMQSRWGITWLEEEPEGSLKTASCSGSAEDEETAKLLLPLAEKCARTGRSLRVADAGADGTLPRGEQPGPRSILLVPLVAFDRTLGVLGVGDREPSGETEGGVFQDEDEQFLSILGTQAAVAIKNAHLFEQVREAEKRLRETQGLLMQTEKLAALGEMSAKVAHEIRNPLSAVGGFARRIQRSLSEGDPNAEYAALIVKEIRRLEGILTEQLEFARLSQPRLANVDLGELTRETLLLIRDEAEHKGVQVLEELGKNLPLVLLDRDKVKQVLLNILNNALGAVKRGNRIQIRTQRVGGDLRIEIANDGEPLPGEMLDNLFVPFATTKAGGSGLGLAVAHQIVKEHGGEIQVRSGAPWSVIFTVSFPIRENQDRRALVERRRSRDRRRAA